MDVYLLVTSLFCMATLCLAGAAYLAEDRQGTKICLLVTLFSWAWPVLIPGSILYFIYRMALFAWEKE